MGQLDPKRLALPRPSRASILILGPLGIIGLAVAAGYAWVSEDAFITFRVVENVVNGYGLRWNVDERVQVFTHPLWMLLHVPIRLLTANLFLATTVLSMLCTALAVVIAARCSGRKPLVLAALLLLPLVLSKSFIEYSTSGLENPLSFLLVAIFAYLLFRKSPERERTAWFGLSLVTALSAVNRLDTGLVFVPVLAHLIASRFRQVRWWRLLIGALPLILWELFSLLYYGFLLPNTAYAKLDTGYGRLQYVYQGLLYLVDFARRDPGGLILVVVATCVALAILARGSRTDDRSRLPAFLGLGAVLYGGYVVWIGGDFMTGRFWSVPVFTAAVALCAAIPNTTSRRALMALAVVMVLAKAATFWTEPAERADGRRRDKSWKSITDERLRYEEGHALFVRDREPRLQLAMPVMTPAPPGAIVLIAIGLKGYGAGPNLKIVDCLALADPLLARLPALPREPIPIGHFRRDIPRGYLEARMTGSARGMNASLAQYYAKLRIITSGRLLDPDRLKTILLFNLGKYDALRDAYVASKEPPDPVEIDLLYRLAGP